MRVQVRMLGTGAESVDVLSFAVARQRGTRPAVGCHGATSTGAHAEPHSFHPCINALVKTRSDEFGFLVYIY